MYKNIIVIAEVKTATPFNTEWVGNWSRRLTKADQIGDILSIHTDPRWKGSFDDIEKAKKMTEKPILAKGIHKTDKDIQRAIDAGADLVLVVGRIPGIHAEKCLIEPYTIAELKKLPRGTRAVWNDRDLSDGGEKTEKFDDARKAWEGWLCQASNIKTVRDIRPGANAILVGTHLMEFAASLRKT